MKHIRPPAVLSLPRPQRGVRAAQLLELGKMEGGWDRPKGAPRLHGTGGYAPKTPLRPKPPFTDVETLSPPPAGRIGAALAEVLIALLVMGIGIVSVATMFPIAVLRTVQATQLTRATVLHLNAKVQLDLYPELIDNAHIPPPAPGDITTAVVDPLGSFLTGAGLFSGGTDVNGNAIVDSTGAPAPLPRVNMATVPGAATQQQAEQLVTLPDSWSVQVDDIVASVNLPALPALPSVTLASPVPAGIPTANGQARITLFHSSGRKSVVRTVTSIVGNTVSWAATPVLPAEYTPTTIERAVVEIRNRHFTWMMTVRKPEQIGDLSFAFDVAVFFNRTHEPSDETAFLTIPANTLDKKFQIDIPATLPPGVTRPLLRRGKYLFDPVNARWYRIAQVEGAETNTPTITLNESPATNKPIRYAVFMPRIVYVYHNLQFPSPSPLP